MKKLKANIFGGGDREVSQHIEKTHNKQFNKALDKKKKDYSDYPGGKRQWNKEEKESAKFAPGGKYHTGK